MNLKKMTVFSQILTAALMPLLISFAIVIGAVNSVISSNKKSHINEASLFAASSTANQIATEMNTLTLLQYNLSLSLAALDFAEPDAKYTADTLLSTLAMTDPPYYYAWYAFEPEVFGDNKHCYRAITGSSGKMREFNLFNNDISSDPDQCTWYCAPFISDEPYISLNRSNVSFDEDERPFIATVAQPIIASGETIGALGVAIRLDDLFIHSTQFNPEEQRVMLLSEQGEIIYSNDPRNLGHSFSDYYPESEYKRADTNEENGGAEYVQFIKKSQILGTDSVICIYPVEINYTSKVVYLYYDIPVSTLGGSFDASMENILIVCAIGFILPTVSLFFTTKILSRQLKQITDSFNRVADEGAADTLSGEHVPIYNTNFKEIALLQSALVSMFIQLRKAHGIKVRALEAELEKEKLIAASEAKTGFLASISHEIRTPMNALTGISEILLLEGGLTERQERYINDIKISASSLLNLINDILDISKLGKNMMSLRPAHYSFHVLINNIVSLSAHLTSRAGLMFIYENEGEIPEYLYGDEYRLRQILLNLIGNAVKYTERGQVLLRVSTSGDMMRIDVEDTGVGIAQEDIDNIFEIFVTAEARRTNDINGTGLGLAIAKSLVQLMNGDITVKSIYGKGSTFSVSIPIVYGDEAKIKRTHYVEKTRFSEDLKILIVDDNEINLNVSYGLFKAAHGIVCDRAKSGREAINMVMKTDYDIVFMDHMMPELNGVDTMLYIREMGGKYSTLPIIALTANAVLGAQKELVEAGMNDFLSKPIDRDALQEILNRWSPENKRLPTEIGKQYEKSVVKPIFESGISVKLESIGIDTKVGFENIGCDEEMYLRSLRMLFTIIPEAQRQLVDQLESNNMKHFSINVHGLKGSLLSIGATELSEHAKKLELASKDGDIEYCKTHLPLLNEKLDYLIKGLEATRIGDEKHTGDTAFDEQTFNCCVTNLLNALDECDYDAIETETASIFSMSYEESLEKRVVKLKRMIDIFDYSNAASYIRSNFGIVEL